MSKPRLLDLFCGAGGAGMGYSRAGFDVVGVDVIDQPNYPFEFHRADAMTFDLSGFDAIHASPPCQAYTNMGNKYRGQGGVADSHPDLVGPTRERLESSGATWVMENVVGAPMPNRVILHGGMFGLGVHKPRQFESNVLVMIPFAAPVKGGWAVYGDRPGGRVTGKSRYANGYNQFRAPSIEAAREAMGIDWMDWHEIKLAIPPAYTEWIGLQLIGYVGGER